MISEELLNADPSEFLFQPATDTTTTEPTGSYATAPPTCSQRLAQTTKQPLTYMNVREECEIVPVYLWEILEELATLVDPRVLEDIQEQFDAVKNTQLKATDAKGICMETGRYIQVDMPTRTCFERLMGEHPELFEGANFVVKTVTRLPDQFAISGYFDLVILDPTSYLYRLIVVDPRNTDMVENCGIEVFMTNEQSVQQTIYLLDPTTNNNTATTTPNGWASVPPPPPSNRQTQQQPSWMSKSSFSSANLASGFHRRFSVAPSSSSEEQQPAGNFMNVNGYKLVEQPVTGQMVPANAFLAQLGYDDIEQPIYPAQSQIGIDIIANEQRGYLAAIALVVRAFLRMPRSF